ncbi:ABC transporter ATP-binding protein [Yanshouia hominis]|uniref:ABC transporter ATP-binding protein n=1 Tax=Yanshouia hominis TaxID=2763673 RepID=A0ABR7NN56_9FIRM|nr:ABC transporter ATP-binding protein [Yanshouia hominis]MBC8577739.1 ABC transporter ATP-binding protein [Yanshouia hominis]
MDKCIEVSQLRAGYGHKDILRGVNFHVAHGEICAILGNNGSGKSTLLHAICGLHPFRGDCFLNGSKLSALSRRKIAQKIAYLGQHSGITFSLNVLDAVLMGYNPSLGVLQGPTSAQKQHALQTLEQLGMGEYAEADFLSLSEGQRKEVLFARALVRETELMVLDEPDSALDFHNKHQMFRFLKERASQIGQSVLLCSHDVNLALEYADHLLMLKNGKIFYDLAVHTVSQDLLSRALSDIYGPVDILLHNETFLMTERKNL